MHTMSKMSRLTVDTSITKNIDNSWNVDKMRKRNEFIKSMIYYCSICLIQFFFSIYIIYYSNNHNCQYASRYDFIRIKRIIVSFHESI